MGNNRALTPAEMTIVDNEYDRMMGLLTEQREVYPFRYSRQWIIDAIQTAFDETNTNSFGGFAPNSDAMGWRPISPYDINPANLQAPQRVNWQVTIPQAAGWAQYTPPVNQPGALLHVDENTKMVILGFADLSQDPSITAAQILPTGDAPGPINQLEDQVRLADLPVSAIVVPIELVGSGNTYGIDVLWDFDAQAPPTIEELQVCGIILQRGSKLTQQIPTVNT